MEKRCTENDKRFLRQAWKSKEDTDGLSQVAALVVNPENRVVGEGLSKWPPGKHWIGKEEYNDFVDQAEIDAIDQRDFPGCTLYTTRCPNEESARHIVRTRLDRVLYVEENHLFKSGLPLLESAKVEVVRVPNLLPEVP
ncbi:uncharacterized protein LOC100897776 isoform X2 [Galendromus occidentalis]|uniref:Uncharacterized protein LOC100897776 isoform X2 n=1 Tax=Galendromus occidentalis TaxID=34638 RepID=A0AAJ6QS51_9ACAR|nr:uncharacterized protein LOC100897776 isoform X2 [Galendromus occidentalis]